MQRFQIYSSDSWIILNQRCEDQILFSKKLLKSKSIFPSCLMFIVIDSPSAKSESCEVSKIAR